MKSLKAVTFVIISFVSGQILAQQKSVPAADDKTFKLFFEKTYVQTDRVYYSTGEDVWFSAYLVNGKSTSLTSTSNNLYVELINSKDQLIDSKLIRMNAGLGNGDFKLKDTLQTGWYNIRAYTNWMRNFGNDFVFQKKIYVTNTLKTSTSQTANPIVTSSKKSITFFPEGGSLVEGLTSIVAFKTNDEIGNGLKAKGSVISSKGDTVTTFQSTEAGMGIFAFTPLPDEKYKVDGFYGTEKFTSALPVALKKGISLHLTTDSANIKASIITNEVTFAEVQGKPISIIIKHAGDNVYTGSITLTKTNASVTIPTKDLPAGIAVVTLLDHLGRPNSERLVYIQSANKINLTVNPDKATYAAREKVTLNVKAINSLGQPIKTNLSLAVVDGIIPTDASNIVSYLMLQSEIKGEIKNADQYFDPQNTGRFKQLDLLLLTQGWREYLWRKLADTSIKISEMPEPGITIRGSVREKLADKPMPNMNITLFGSGFVGNKLYTTKTDAAGRYFLDGLNWSGYQAIKLSSQDNKGKKGGWLQIDSVVKPFAINLKKLNPFEIPTTLNADLGSRMAYNRKFKIGDSIMLDEVKIVGEKKEAILLPDGGSLMTFGYKDQVFNITAADYVFKGLEHFLLTKAELARPIPIDDSTGNEGIYFGSSRPLILVNNRLDLQDRLDYYSLTMDQINKIVIKHLINNQGKDVFVMYLDLKDSALRGPNLHLLNIGLNGYYSARTFYSPNYVSNEATVKDFRTTLLWAPLLKTNEKGEVSVSFYNSDNKGNVNIRVDGITEQGAAVATKSTYKVQ
ncbi:hypothetical protein EZ428_08425 [Pedobacter frigiditerrae]|uniref:MG2 domain-containing protein n=1 Tax=Pedobacter frigiditerrae TaxID=2530452 RepID=A0A4R0MWX5_9SPHI|nr:hypothetical protein [Pedobacter frigiditerrae]TCC91769.1 hypothetical protein EZ428_08425 [Pedobacter frigiditerrae]